MSNILSYAVGGGANVQWKTLLDIDFTTEPAQTLSPDGDYTIGGFVFAKTNSAKEVNAAELTAGVGIEIEPTTDTNNWNAVQNFPRLVLNLATNIPDFSPSTRIRAWSRTTGNYSAVFDETVLQIQDVTSGSHLAWERTFSTSPGPGNQLSRHAQDTWFNVSSDIGYNILDGGYDVYVIDCNGVGLGLDQFLAYSGTWAGGWPAASTLVPTFWWCNEASTPYYYSASLKDASAWGVAIGALRDGGSAGFVGVFQALKIEYLVAT